MPNSPTLALSLLLTTDNGSFEYLNCMRRYITMVCNFRDIHAPLNLLLSLKSDQRSISCKGSQTLEIETQTEKITDIPPHGNTSPDFVYDLNFLRKTITIWVAPIINTIYGNKSYYQWLVSSGGYTFINNREQNNSFWCCLHLGFYKSLKFTVSWIHCGCTEICNKYLCRFQKKQVAQCMIKTFH